MRTEVGDFLRRESTLVPDNRKFRVTLNEKEPNKDVLSSPFKMKTLDTCLSEDAEQLITGLFRFKRCLFYASYP